MKNVLAASIIVMCPIAALAETQIEKLERLSVAMNDIMFAAMIDMVEKEGGNPEPLRETIPDSTWDDEYRAAGSCLLDKLAAASSTGAVDQMLAEMDEALPQIASMDIENMDEELDFTPEGISDDYMIEANDECGLVDISLKRMEESGFTAAMMQSMMDN